MLKRYMKSYVSFISTHCIIANSPLTLIRIMSKDRTRNMLSINEYLIALLCVSNTFKLNKRGTARIKPYPVVYILNEDKDTKSHVKYQSLINGYIVQEWGRGHCLCEGRYPLPYYRPCFLALSAP